MLPSRLVASTALVAFVLLVLTMTAGLLSPASVALIIAAVASVGIALVLESGPPRSKNRIVVGLILVNLTAIGIGNTLIERDTRGLQNEVTELRGRIGQLTTGIQSALDALKNNQASSEEIVRLLQGFLIEAGRTSVPSQGSSRPAATPTPLPLVCSRTGAFGVLRTSIDSARPVLGDTVSIVVTVCNDAGRALAIGADPQVARPDEGFFTSPGEFVGYRTVAVAAGASVDLPAVPLRLDRRGPYRIYGAAFTDTDRSTLKYWFTTDWDHPILLMVE